MGHQGEESLVELEHSGTIGVEVTNNGRTRKALSWPHVFSRGVLVGHSFDSDAEYKVALAHHQSGGICTQCPATRFKTSSAYWRGMVEKILFLNEGFVALNDHESKEWRVDQIARMILATEKNGA